MLLTPKFGLFCQQIGVQPFVDGRIEPFSRNFSNSEEFGLGCVYNNETGNIHVTIGERAGLSLSTMVSGFVALYRVIDARSDYLLKSTEIDTAFLRNDKSIVVTFNSQSPDDLWIACSITFPSKTLASICSAVQDESTKSIIPPLTSTYRLGFNSAHEKIHEVPEKNLIIKEDEVYGKLIELDFSNPKPVIYGSGSIFYAGGGNRYLPTPEGVVVQSQNAAPWKLLGPCWIEDAGGNVFDKYGLHSTCWSWTSTGKPEVVESMFMLSGFNERAVSFSINETDGLDREWELVFDPTPWTGHTVSGSCFLKVDSIDELSSIEVGLKLLNSNGSVRDTRWTKLESSDQFNVVGSSFYLKQTDVPIAGLVSLAVRLKGIARGQSPIVSVAFPQIEYSPIPSSRSLSSRQADTLYYQNSDKFYPDYGRIEVSFTPLYNGFPKACGHQLLVDTRDSSGRNGLWIAHKANGIFEFGSCDNLGSTIVQSSSTIAVKENIPHTVVARWNAESKNMRLDIDGVKLVEKTFQTFTNTQLINTVRFGTRYDGQHRGSFQIHSFKHEEFDDDDTE
jgi:hypothetical protein